MRICELGGGVLNGKSKLLLLDELVEILSECVRVLSEGLRILSETSP